MKWTILQIAFFLPTINMYTYTDEANLISNITSSYQKYVRPDETTHISISIGLLSISEVNTVSQEITLMGILMAGWEDSRLTWDPANFNNSIWTFIKNGNIWTPPLIINNAADSIRLINDDGDLASVYSLVTYNGEVKWLTPINVVASCDINISKYPFDSQTCEIILSTWMFSTDDIFLNTGYETINLDLYSINGEWDIISTSVSPKERTLLGYSMSAVSFTINLKRKYSYYVLNMILPVIILAIIGPFVFLLQNDSGYAITILLSMSVVMATVSDSIPPTANNVSILSVYLLVTYILCAAETVVVVLMCHLQNYHEKEYKPGDRTQKFVHYVAMITRYRRADEAKHSNSNRVNSEISSIEVVNDKKKAFPMEQSAESDNDVTRNKRTREYSFDECVYILNFFNFYLFLFLTCLITLVFMLALMT